MTEVETPEVDKPEIAGSTHDRKGGSGRSVVGNLVASYSSENMQHVRPAGCACYQN